MRLGAGDVSGAGADLETLQLLAGHLYRSPIYHHHTWAGEMAQAVARLMGGVIAAGEYTESQRDAFRAWLETPRPQVRVRDVLAYDKMIYLDAAQRGVKLQAWFVRELPELPFNANRATQELAQAYRWAEELNSVKKMAEETADFEPLYDLTIREALATQFFTRARTDYLIACVKRKAIQLVESPQQGSMAEAYRDLARVALAVAEYRAKHGDFPETLAVLVPEYLVEVPVDVFLPGAKVKYRVEPDRAVIYSAGHDGEDNGGTVDYYEDGFIPENAGDNVAVPESDLVLRVRCPEGA